MEEEVKKSNRGCLWLVFVVVVLVVAGDFVVAVVGIVVAVVVGVLSGLLGLFR